MREIKFRVWDKVNKVIRYYGFRELGIFEDCFTEKDIMQFTGIKDKNGKEIYEGDVVKWVKNNNRNIDSWFFNKNGLIRWVTKDDFVSIYSGWGIEFKQNLIGKNGISLGNADCEKAIEIIGNIYENPELLMEQ